MTRTDVLQAADVYLTGMDECTADSGFVGGGGDSGGGGEGGSGEAFVQCVGDGAFTFFVRATDTHGNVGPAAAATVVVDVTSPTLDWIQRPPSLLSGRSGLVARFDFQSNEVDVEGAWSPSFAA
jgi:hypothetical protein